MPAVVAPAIAAAVSAGFSGGFTFSVLGSAFLRSIAMSAVSRLLTPKPKAAGSGFDAFKSSGMTQQFRQPITERRMIYGECRVSGPITYVGSSQNNKFNHFIITLATHEVDAIDEVIIDDQSIPIDFLDGSGNVTQGRYANKVRIKKYLGTASQTADPDLLAEIPAEWTSAHRGRGVAYLYVRCEWDRDVFPSGTPNFSAWVRGKKLVDTRNFNFANQRITEAGDNRITQDTSFRVTENINIGTVARSWSPNICLITYDYLTDPEFGLGVDYNRVDDITADLTANECDEIVTCKNKIYTAISADSATDIITLSGTVLELMRGDRVQLGATTIAGLSTGVDYYVIPYQRQGVPRIRLATSLTNAINGVAINFTSGGTASIVKNGEPRYHGGGVIKLDQPHDENIKEIVTGMGGKVIYSGGKWYIVGLSYQTPIYSFDETDLIGSVSIQTRVSRRDKFNQIGGAYISQVNQGNPSDYPIVKSTVYATADNADLFKKLDLPFTQRPQTAQRIAKIIMEYERQEIRFTARYKLTAMKLRCGDTFMQTFGKYGWTNKVFEVLEWKIGVDTGNDSPVPYVEILAKESAASVYAFESATDEVEVDPALNTTLANPFDVSVVSGFALDSVPVTTLGGDTTYKILASWTAPSNAFVTSLGQFEIQYKQTSETAYRNTAIFDGSAIQVELFQAQAGLQYDVRIRAINSLGRRSAYTTVTNFVVGSSGGVSTREDWENKTETRNPDDWETDSGANEDWEA